MAAEEAQLVGGWCSLRGGGQRDMVRLAARSRRLKVASHPIKATKA